MNGDYWARLTKQLDQVYASHPELRDHRREHPWLTGALGDPNSGIIFLAEKPSLRMVERATSPNGGDISPEAQWYASRGDKLFRDMLFKHGFKETPREIPGGWKCYITNVIKHAEYVKEWQEESKQKQLEAARIWSIVLKWELQQIKPQLVVILGNKVRKLVEYLGRECNLTLPLTVKIHHHSYVALRPRGKLGPLHPTRIMEYDNDFARMRSFFEAIREVDEANRR